jgi:hypothetical protein
MPFKRSMDAGATAPLPAAIAIDLALLAVFGVPHSGVANLSLGLITWRWRALPAVASKNGHSRAPTARHIAPTARGCRRSSRRDAAREREHDRV